MQFTGGTGHIKPQLPPLLGAWEGWRATPGKWEDTDHPNNSAEQSTEEEVTGFSTDTSKLYLQLTPVTPVIPVPRGGRAEGTCQPLPLVIKTRVHTPGTAPEKVSVMDPSPAGSCPGGAMPGWSHQELPCASFSPIPLAQSPSRGSGQS